MIPLVHFRGQRETPWHDNELRNKVVAKFEQFGITMCTTADDMKVWFVPFDQKKGSDFVKLLDLMNVNYHDASP